MSQLAIRFEAEVQPGGSLRFLESSFWAATLSSFIGKHVWITIEQWRQVRSNQQNRWYWVAIVPAVAEELSRRCLAKDPLWNNGLPLSNDQTHILLKRTFIGVIETPLGDSAKDSHDLTTVEFSDYCERIRAHAAIEWGLNIPGPNESWMET